MKFVIYLSIIFYIIPSCTSGCWGRISSSYRNRQNEIRRLYRLKMCSDHKCVAISKPLDLKKFPYPSKNNDNGYLPPRLAENDKGYLPPKSANRVSENIIKLDSDAAQYLLPPSIPLHKKFDIGDNRKDGHPCVDCNTVADLNLITKIIK